MPSKTIKNLKLKNGRSAELVVVTPPAPEWYEPISKFANSPPESKGPNRHEIFLKTNDLQGLGVYYYLVLVEREIVGLMLVTDHAGAGYINTTFVVREWRGQGVMSAIMKAQEKEFHNRGGRIRMLDTRNNSPAFEMFKRYGYKAKDLKPEDKRAYMEKHHDNITWEEFYRTDGSDLTVDDITYAHFSGFTALDWCQKGKRCRRDGGPHLDSLRLYKDLPGFQWKCLVNSRKRLYGDAVLWPYDNAHPLYQSNGKEFVLDLFVHSGYGNHRKVLFDSLILPEGRTRVFLDAVFQDQINFFEEQGFQLEEKVLEDYLHHGTRTQDVRIYSLRKD